MNEAKGRGKGRRRPAVVGLKPQQTIEFRLLRIAREARNDGETASPHGRGTPDTKKAGWFLTIQPLSQLPSPLKVREVVQTSAVFSRHCPDGRTFGSLSGNPAKDSNSPSTRGRSERVRRDPYRLEGH